jgi:hypothetical protein
MFVASAGSGSIEDEVSGVTEGVGELLDETVGEVEEFEGKGSVPFAGEALGVSVGVWTGANVGIGVAAGFTPVLMSQKSSLSVTFLTLYPARA